MDKELLFFSTPTCILAHEACISKKIPCGRSVGVAPRHKRRRFCVLYALCALNFVATHASTLCFLSCLATPSIS